MNEDNYALIFSFYSTSSNPIKSLDTDAEIRFSVLTPKQANRVLYGDGNAFDMTSTDGEIETEKYNRFAYYDIDNDAGINMYNYAVQLYDNPGDYKLLSRQCDDIAVEIFRKGGIEIESKFRPNSTYNDLDAHKWRGEWF